LVTKKILVPTLRQNRAKGKLLLTHRTIGFNNSSPNTNKYFSFSQMVITYFIGLTTCLGQ